MVKAMTVLGSGEDAAPCVGIFRPQMRRRDDVVAHRQEIEPSALGGDGDGLVVLAGREDAARDSTQSELHGRLRCWAVVAPMLRHCVEQCFGHL